MGTRYSVSLTRWLTNTVNLLYLLSSFLKHNILGFIQMTSHVYVFIYLSWQQKAKGEWGRVQTVGIMTAKDFDEIRNLTIINICFMLSLWCVTMTITILLWWDFHFTYPAAFVGQLSCACCVYTQTLTHTHVKLFLATHILIRRAKATHCSSKAPFPAWCGHMTPVCRAPS